MHKIYITLQTIDEWYDIIRELKRWFGNDWKGQRGIRKKFIHPGWFFEPREVWFLVPDLAFKTFIELKMSNDPNLR